MITCACHCLSVYKLLSSNCLHLRTKTAATERDICLFDYVTSSFRIYCKIMTLLYQTSRYICKCIRSVYVEIEILFFNLIDVMKTVFVARILDVALRVSLNISSANFLHHIMKVENTILSLK